MHVTCCLWLGDVHIGFGAPSVKHLLPIDAASVRLRPEPSCVAALRCSECCAQPTGNNRQTTSNLDSGGSGNGSNTIVIMAVLVSLSVALIAGILACIFCCYR